MNNSLILLETIQTLCEGISQQHGIFQNDQLIDPLLPDFDNPGNPVAPNVDNPGNLVVPNVDNLESVTLYHTASRKLRAAIAASIRSLMIEHQFQLPLNWTYEQLADEIIGQAVDLSGLFHIFNELCTFGYASQPFHQLLGFLHTVAQPAAGVFGG